jgi:exodeoxyribonuclease-3
MNDRRRQNPAYGLLREDPRYHRFEMKIATFNVNSIRARKERVLRWLEREAPDVACLQELKAEEHDMPLAELDALGYRIAAAYQKSYNGVAILSRKPLGDVQVGLQDDEVDDQARVVAATVDGVRVVSVYVPNGAEVGSDKWHYKLRFLDRLSRYLVERCDLRAPFVIGGDYNVAPDERDVHKPRDWVSTVLFHPEVRAALERVRVRGLYDTFRMLHQEAGRYSWWDYRAGSFQRDDGLRIDQLYASATLAERLTAASIDRKEREGELPSDHAPCLAEFSP